jgi:DNA-binding CsgD family transcriptional regulator
MTASDIFSCAYTLLTVREREVLSLIGRGRTTKEIAGILGISPATVGNHRKSLCRKLDMHSTAQLASFGSSMSLTVT